MITGQFNQYSYQIFSDDNLIYEAGNNPLDSAVSQSLNPANGGLSLSMLKLYCETTACELAGERDEELGKIFFVE